MDRRNFISLLPGMVLLGCASTSPQSNTTTGPRFSDAERELIVNHFAAERGRGPAREKPAQRVKPGDLMDTGLRPNKLPTVLDQKLIQPPSPYTRLILGADVILVNRDTHVIADVIPQIAY